MDLIKNKISFVFNRVAINFLKDIKNQDANLKKKIKKNYKVYNKSSHDHIIYFWNKMTDVHNVIQADNLDYNLLINNETFCSIYFMKGIQIGKLFEIFNSNKNIILSYILTLYLFAYLYNDINEENYKDIDTLLHRVLIVINSIDDDAEENKELDMNELLEDIIDDTIKQIIIIIKELKIQVIDEFDIPTEEEPFNDFEKYSNMIENSKIGSLAKDICADIQDLNIDMSASPEELMQNMFSPSNNLIGNLIQKVGTTLTTKISSGELNQEELLGDAFKLLGQINNNTSDSSSSLINNLMSNVMSSMGNMSMGGDNTGETNDMPNFGNMEEMMKMASGLMSGMGTDTRIDKNKINQMSQKSKTRERLRKKIENKQIEAKKED